MLNERLAEEVTGAHVDGLDLATRIQDAIDKLPLYNEEGDSEDDGRKSLDKLKRLTPLLWDIAQILEL